MNNFTEEIVEIEYINKTKVKLCKESLGISGSFSLTGQVEITTLNFIYDKLHDKSNPVLIDVGANVGSYALLPILIPNLTVHCFEPISDTCDILRKNIKLNNIEGNVVINNFALGNENKQALIYYLKDMHGHSSIVQGKPQNPFYIPVDMITLDSYVETIGLDHIDIIKIDTEGYDCVVLKGCEHTISRFNPFVITEKECDAEFALLNYIREPTRIGAIVDAGYLYYRE